MQLIRKFHRLLVVAIMCVPVGLRAQSADTSPLLPYTDRITALMNGDRARETVSFLDQYVRWPGNRGFDASIAHIAEQLEAAGFVREDRATDAQALVYRVERYPMAQPAWEPLDATVTIEGDTAPLLRFTSNRNMLATNSFSTPDGGVSASVVWAGNGTPADFDAAGEVRGKIVAANASVGRVFTEAVVRRGALGVLGYSLPDYLRPEQNRNSIQFASVPRDTAAKAWGIALSFDARDRLQQALARGPVRIRVHTQSLFTPDAVEQTVVAEVRGTTHAHERFVFSAHVQEPGANDNASGVGAQLEMARVMARLLGEGMPRPARTLTFLWGLEIRSTDRFITQDTMRARDIRWGMSLDMVGEDTEKTGGTFLIEKMPDPSAIWTRGDDKHSEWGGRPLTKADLKPHYFNDYVLARALAHAATTDWVVNTNPFEGGSDHTPFLRANKPGLLLWHFTDQFYHTDGDRLDKVSAKTLRNVAITALTSALPLANGTSVTAGRIVNEVQRAAIERLAAEAEQATTNIAQASASSRDSLRTHERDILETWTQYYVDVLTTVRDVELGGPSAETQASIARAQRDVRAAGERHLSSLSNEGAAQSAAATRAQGDAASLSLVSYNIRHGAGTDNVVDLPRTANVLRALNADVIALQEVDERVTRSGGAPQADSLGALLGMHAAFGAFMPYQGGEYGLALLSRHPIVRSTALRLPDGNEPRVALIAELAIPGSDTIAVINVHFDWVGNDTLRYAQAEALTRVLDTLSRPYVVLGDFNDEPGSRTLALFRERATEAVKSGERFTFPSDTPVKEIDFVFAAPRSAWQHATSRVVDERIASDHRPVHATITRQP